MFMYVFGSIDSVKPYILCIFELFLFIHLQYVLSPITMFKELFALITLLNTGFQQKGNEKKYPRNTKWHDIYVAFLLLLLREVDIFDYLVNIQ